MNGIKNYIKFLIALYITRKTIEAIWEIWHSEKFAIFCYHWGLYTKSVNDMLEAYIPIMIISIFISLFFLSVVCIYSLNKDYKDIWHLWKMHKKLIILIIFIPLFALLLGYWTFIVYYYTFQYIGIMFFEIIKKFDSEDLKKKNWFWEILICLLISTVGFLLCLIFMIFVEFNLNYLYYAYVLAYMAWWEFFFLRNHRNIKFSFFNVMKYSFFLFIFLFSIFIAIYFY
jgi:hypothetical protein